MEFSVTMMCGSCKWKITNALHHYGITDFSIDLNTNRLVASNQYNPDLILRIVEELGYKIHLNLK